MSAKKLKDLTQYIGILPYSSEMSGVYQPLLGWKSRRKQERYFSAHDEHQQKLLRQQLDILKGKFQVNINSPLHELIQHHPLEPSPLASFIHIDVTTQSPVQWKQHDSLLLTKLSTHIQQQLTDIRDIQTLEKEFRKILPELIQNDSLIRYLNDPEQGILSAVVKKFENAIQQHNPDTETELNLEDGQKKLLHDLLNLESKTASALLLLREQKLFDELGSLFFSAQAPITQIRRSLSTNLYDSIKPDIKEKANSISLSPIGLVHLFRQYFFELDSFLGTPVGHVWLSPGASAELYEVTTKRSLSEQTTEFSTDITVHNEKSSDSNDELSEEIKNNNKQDIKLGASVSASYSSITASSHFDFNHSQEEARENVHKRTRQQTEKVSQDLKQQYKTTFKTVNELTNTSSKRYVLNNTTQELINYDMRRKMRQVAVQIQDIGSYLCWEAFVDEPGKDLGLANLVHIASDQNLHKIPDPDKVILPAHEDIILEINYRWEIESLPDGFHEFQRIKVIPPRPGYILSASEYFIERISGPAWDFQIKDQGVVVDGEKLIPELIFGLSIHNGGNGINDDRTYDFKFKLFMRYIPSKQATEQNRLTNEALLQKTTEERSRVAQEDFIKKVQERITQASIIKTRNHDALREEERIIVYRHLIASLLTDVNYKGAPPEVRHNLSEYLNSLFDIDKMLYFVAPEWWKPRIHYGQFVGQETSSAPAAKSGNDLLKSFSTPSKYTHLLNGQPPLQETRVSNAYIANWSGNEKRPDNYFITEKSAPARLGASLGWVMQLDGDNMRNAFLNAPWVKTVLPIRPGKEAEAVEWLKSAKVEGTSGLDALTEERDAAGNQLSITQAIDQLIARLNDKYEYQKSLRQVGDKVFNDLVDGDGNPVVIDDRDQVLARPINKVYEHGFYPLENSFALKPNPEDNSGYYDVFDQWIEIVPTDQIVPVPVKYDPKTGRMI